MNNRIRITDVSLVVLMILEFILIFVRPIIANSLPTPTADQLEVELMASSQGEQISRMAFDRDGRLYTGLRNGSVFQYQSPTSATLCLSLPSGKVEPPSIQERGLCGLAFSPIDNRVWLSYSAQPGIYPGVGEGDLVVEEYLQDAQTGVIDSLSARFIISVARAPDSVYTAYPDGGGNGFWAHYSGQIVPVVETIGVDADLVLYIATGDRGAYLGRGQPGPNDGSPYWASVPRNPKNLCGKLLRIIATDHGDAVPYLIPSDNPFFGNAQGYREEIVGIGCRNPWDFKYDPITRLFVKPESGQDVREYGHLVAPNSWEPGKPLDFGWNIIEGYGLGNGVNLTTTWGGIYPLPGIQPLPNQDVFGNPTLPSQPVKLGFVHQDMKTVVGESATYPEGECMAGMLIYHNTDIPSWTDGLLGGDFTNGKIYLLQPGAEEGVEVFDLNSHIPGGINLVGMSADPNTRQVVVALLDGRIFRIQPRYLNDAKDWSVFE